MNWGGFAGGLAGGIATGMQVGKMINQARKEKKIAEAGEAGVNAAQEERNKHIDSQIQENNVAAQRGISGQQPAEAVTAPAPVPTESLVQNPEKATGAVVMPVTDGAGTTPSNPGGDVAPTTQGAAAGAMPTAAGGLPFMVGGKGYATREEARAAAEKNAPDVMHFMNKTLVPKMQETYLRMGDAEKAAAWGKWAEDRDNQAAMKEWGGAMRAAQMGNIEKAADHVFNLYKRYDDGVTPVSKETVKDNAGNVTGFNVKLKNDKTGEEFSQFVDRKALTEMGLAALAPPQMFELTYKRQMEAEKMAAAAAAENAKDVRNFKQDIYKSDRKHEQTKEIEGVKLGNKLEELSTKEQLEATRLGETGKKIRDLKAAGWSQERIDSYLDKDGQFKKTTNPTERRALVVSDLLKNNHQFSRMAPEEQNKLVDKTMGIIYGNDKPAAQSAPAGGLPKAPAQSPAGQKKGVPVFDTKTGTIVYR